MIGMIKTILHFASFLPYIIICILLSVLSTYKYITHNLHVSTEKGKTLYDVKNIYCMPLIYLMEASLLVFIYLIAHYFLNLFYDITLLSKLIPNLFETFVYGCCVTFYLMIVLLVIEYVIRYMNLWDMFTSRSAALRFIYTINTLMVILYILVYVFAKQLPNDLFRFLQISDDFEGTNMGVLFICVLISIFLNRALPDIKDKTKKQMTYIVYTCVFFLVLLFG